MPVDFLSENAESRLQPVRRRSVGRATRSVLSSSTLTGNCASYGTRTLGLRKSSCSRSEALSVHSCSIATQTPNRSGAHQRSRGPPAGEKMRALTAHLSCAACTVPKGEAVLAQAVDGHLVGIVLDQTGGAIPGCSMVVENVNTGVGWNQETDELGAYRFNNLSVGQYTLSTESEGFAPTILSGIAIALNRSTTVNVTLELGNVQTEVEVTVATARIDTTSSMIGGSFDSRQALYRPSSDLALGVLNLSLQGAGVASSGGTGLGEGPSIGGQRPRNNNFMVEGVDNNDKSVTGRIVDIPNEAVAEFSLLQNQYGAEFVNYQGNSPIWGSTSSRFS